MNSTVRHGEGGLTMAGQSTSKAMAGLRGSRWLVRRCEAGWGDVITEACWAWLDPSSSPGVPVAAWPEGALCDPVKMVFTDSS